MSGETNEPGKPEESQPESVTPLDYRGPLSRQGDWRRSDLYLGAGFFIAWLAVSVALAIGIRQLNLGGATSAAVITLLVAALVVLVVIVGRMIFQGRRAFFPGVLIGVGLSILLLAGICAVVVINI